MGTLKRAIGLPGATALVVGTIIGSSVFVQASELTSLVPDPLWVIVAWAVAGVLTMIGALVCAELSSAYPRTGGVYVFFKEIYSPTLGFLWGWAMFWTMHSGILAAIATVFARYAGYFVELDLTGQRLVAVSAILVLSAVNYRGVTFGANLQSAFTLVKVLAVMAIMILGFALFRGAPPAPAEALLPVTFPNFLLAVGAGLFAYGGWHMVTYTAEETVDPTRTIPRSLLIGIVVVTLAYIGLNVVYLMVLPLQSVMTSSRVAADTFEVLIGPGAAGAAAGGPVLGICNGFQILLEAGLLPGAMLRNRDLKFRCEHVHIRVEQTDTPFTAACCLHQVLRIPIAHGEGNYFTTPDQLTLLEKNRQVVFRYVNESGDATDAANPNGSVESIAGICNERRNVVGLMPHPERACETAIGSRDGLVLFESVIKAHTAGALTAAGRS